MAKVKLFMTPTEWRDLKADPDTACVVADVEYEDAPANRGHACHLRSTSLGIIETQAAPLDDSDQRIVVAEGIVTTLDSGVSIVSDIKLAVVLGYVRMTPLEWEILRSESSDRAISVRIQYRSGSSLVTGWCNLVSLSGGLVTHNAIGDTSPYEECSVTALAGLTFVLRDMVVASRLVQCIARST